MRQFGLLLIVVIALMLLPSIPFLTDCNNVALGSPMKCCKICVKGKACGNTCISRSYTCWKGPGCACNARAGVDPSAVFYVRGLDKF